MFSMIYEISESVIGFFIWATRAITCYELNEMIGNEISVVEPTQLHQIVSTMDNFLKRDIYSEQFYVTSFTIN